MAIIIEDGSIVANADSYVSEADTDTYNTSYVGSTDWSTATTADKEIALRQATQYLDTVYFNKWRGERVSSNQALQWPRVYAEYDDGICISDSEIPVPLKKAAMELAIKATQQTASLLVDVDGANQQIKAKTEKVGPLTKAVEYVGSASTQKKFTIVERLVRPLLTTSFVERA